MASIAIIGTGNVAFHLVRALSNQHRIEQVFGRDITKAQVLADTCRSKAISSFHDLKIDFDFYIIAVSDSAINTIVQSLNPEIKGIILHTSGSTDLSVYYDSCLANYGVFYPLQTFTKSKDVDWSKLTLFIESNAENNLKKIEQLAESLNPRQVLALSSEKRKYLHLSAVFVSNFTNYMYQLANTITQEIDIPFEALLPLIDETAEKVHSLKPYDAQTGPARRGDKNVIQAHEQLLKDENLKEIYKLLSKNIMNLYKK